MAENENSPQWKQKDMKLDETVRLTLISSGPIASGKSQYGLWEMWKIGVTNQQVYKKDKTKIENYTGEAIMFPPEKLRQKFTDHTGGINENVVVEVTKKAKTTERGGLYTDYEVVLINGGAPTVVSNSSNPFLVQSSGNSEISDMNGVEQKFITDAKSTKQQVESTGGIFTKEQFIGAAKSTYNVSDVRASELWDKYMQ